MSPADLRRPAALRALSEVLTTAVLLPTAAVGSVIRLCRVGAGLPPIVFGPPSNGSCSWSAMHAVQAQVVQATKPKS